MLALTQVRIEHFLHNHSTTKTIEELMPRALTVLAFNATQDNGFTFSEVSASIRRTFQQLFGREPDEPRLELWIDGNKHATTQLAGCTSVIVGKGTHYHLQTPPADRRFARQHVELFPLGQRRLGFAPGERNVFLEVPPDTAQIYEHMKQDPEYIESERETPRASFESSQRQQVLIPGKRLSFGFESGNATLQVHGDLSNAQMLHSSRFEYDECLAERKRADMERRINDMIRHREKNGRF
jgi:hypothetical protein